MLFALLLAVSPVMSPTPVADVSAIWREADVADHQQHDYAKAIALYERIVSEFPAARLERSAETRRDYLVRGVKSGEEPLRRFEIVREHYGSTNHAEAFAEVQAIVRQYPQFSLLDEALLWLGDRSSEAGRWNEARANYQNLLDHSPQSPLRGYAFAGVGHAAFETGDYSAAEQAYEKIRGTGIPGDEQVAEGEAERVRLHVRRRHGLFVAIGVLFGALLFGALTVDRARILPAARSAFGRELLYAGPIAAILVAITPSEGRLDLACVALAGLGMLVLSIFWAEAARPALARRGMRIAATGIATLAGAAVLYAVLYARDVLVALEQVRGSS